MSSVLVLLLFFLMFRFSDEFFCRVLVTMTPAFLVPLFEQSLTNREQRSPAEVSQEERDGPALKGLSSVPRHPPRRCAFKDPQRKLSRQKAGFLFQRARNTVCWQWCCSSQPSSGLLITDSAPSVEPLSSSTNAHFLRQKYQNK